MARKQSEKKMPQLVGFLFFFIVFSLGPRCGMALPVFRVSHLDIPPGNALTEAPRGLSYYSPQSSSVQSSEQD